MKIFFPLCFVFLSQLTFAQSNGEVQNSDTSYKFDVGSRYMYSKNTTKWQYYNSSSIYGNPAATLDWDNLTANNLELFSKGTSIDTNLFVKGLIGFGVDTKNAGSMLDVDYLKNQVTYISSTSSANVSKNLYASIDFGKDFNFGETTLSPFVGYYYWTTRLEAYGGTLNSVSDNTWYNTYGYSAGDSYYLNQVTIAYQTIVQGPRVG